MQGQPTEGGTGNHRGEFSVSTKILSEITSDRSGGIADDVEFTSAGNMPSVFSVTDLAAASMGAAGLAISDLLRTVDGRNRKVKVDRRLASFWFAASLHPHGWAPPPPWDPIAGDYRTADGWIRLHTNAPRHREAALRVLDVTSDQEKVSAAVLSWNAGPLETAIVKAGGCAAEMYSEVRWLQSETGRAVVHEPLIAWEDIGQARRLTLPLEEERPLTGLRVLDLTRVLAGPVATRLLGLLGADVLRIDPPEWDEEAVVPEVMLGKRAARLDLHRDDGRQRFITLLSQTDVLVHGYRPDALEQLGFGEEVRQSVRPGLIEVTLNAYGWTGAWKTRRGFDSLVQMSSGIADTGMRLMGRDRPTPLPVQALDHATGYLMAFAALSAVNNRIRKGRSMRAKLSLARTSYLLSRYRGTGGEELTQSTAADLNAQIEETGWGPATRLRFPMTVEGVSFQTDRPAMPLGFADARFE